MSFEWSKSIEIITSLPCPTTDMKKDFLNKFLSGPDRKLASPDHIRSGPDNIWSGLVNILSGPNIQSGPDNI